MLAIGHRHSRNGLRVVRFLLVESSGLGSLAARYFSSQPADQWCSTFQLKDSELRAGTQRLQLLTSVLLNGGSYKVLRGVASPGRVVWLQGVQNFAWEGLFLKFERLLTAISCSPR